MNHNLSVRVDKSSKKPDHLVLTFLNQGGQTGIYMVTVYAQNNFTRVERDMDHKRGAVWEMKNALQGSLSFRLFVYSGYDRSFVYSNKDLPADWKVGKIYDLGVQMNDRIDKRDGCIPNCTD
ncbi:expansin-like A2 [Papaver somniferum]|nr:expansin-like A2 [Papaver somniferum]